MFEAANTATFALEDKIKYEFDMTTERDIRNQIRYAEKKGREEGREEGREQQAMETALRMLSMGLGREVIVQATGLTAEQIKAL